MTCATLLSYLIYFNRDLEQEREDLAYFRRKRTKVEKRERDEEKGKVRRDLDPSKSLPLSL
jgi:hypothetical protein